MGYVVKRIEGETSKQQALRLAKEVYELHIEELRVMESLRVRDRDQLALLAVINKAIIDCGVHLARAVLNAETEKAA